MNRLFPSEHCRDVEEASTPDELTRAVVRFANDHGFGTISAMVVVDRAGRESDFYTVHNTPAGYMDAFDDRSLSRTDPVLQHAKRSSTPLLWNQDTYVSAGVGLMWEHQAQYGFRNGLALALHLPHGRHFFLGGDSDQTLSPNYKTIEFIVKRFRLLANRAQESAFKILAPFDPEFDLKSPLTAEEIEALRISMDAASPARVAFKMNISEQQARHHINSAMNKMGVSTKYQAIVKGLRLKLYSANQRDNVGPE